MELCNKEITKDERRKRRYWTGTKFVGGFTDWNEAAIVCIPWAPSQREGTIDRQLNGPLQPLLWKDAFLWLINQISLSQATVSDRALLFSDDLRLALARLLDMAWAWTKSANYDILCGADLCPDMKSVTPNLAWTSMMLPCVKLTCLCTVCATNFYPF